MRTGRLDVDRPVNSRRLSPLERLALRVTVTADGCWQVSSVAPGAYAKAGGCLAHRLVYESLVGPIPDGFHIDHLCRNTRCVCPWHLEPVTPAENVRRGIGPSAVNGKKSHCNRGHELVPANLIPRQVGRECRLCAREAERLRYHRKDRRR
jgi:hypothetical protein